MATVITLPAIHGLDKEKCFPKGPTRLWNYFSVDNYSLKHSKIFKPHLFIPTNEVKLSYQKMAPKFEFIRDLEPTTPCDPLCQEGWYFDCETETCKEYSGYYLLINPVKTLYTKAFNHDTLIIHDINIIDVGSSGYISSVYGDDISYNEDGIQYNQVSIPKLNNLYKNKLLGLGSSGTLIAKEFIAVYSTKSGSISALNAYLSGAIINGLMVMDTSVLHEVSIYGVK